MATITAAPQPAPKPKKYVPTVGPRLKKLLYVVLALVALLGANAVYLASITALEFISRQRGEPVIYQNYFYLMMLLAHVVLGLLLVGPFVVFGAMHLAVARTRRNRRAVRIGYALFAVSIVALITGILLVRIEGLLDLKNPVARSTVYWLHVATPLAAGWLYWLHRLAGPRIKWRIGIVYASVVGAVVVGMVALHKHDPRRWNVVGPAEGTKYFRPSLARTATGDFIPAKTLMMDSYCLSCHADAYKDWFHSAHHFSSFNNPAYLASVRETREVSLKRDGDVKASRWCAGCHDPVPFFSGAFDDPKFDLVNHSTSQAGITCTSCHAITHINSTLGNADYTIEEPQHYPFAFSDNRFLRFVNQQLVKAKPSFHKQTFLKPLHKSAEFCSTCHKVSLPYALNHYKEFLRGQNHYDTYLLSGVSGHGARSFYYPDKAITNCAGCHMTPQKSNDFGARLLEPEKNELAIHNHSFWGGNTGVPWFNNVPDRVAEQQKFLQDKLRVDLFGIKRGGTIDGQLTAPLRPQIPELKPGETYLLETVIRTLKLGHPFTQGTSDSNEVWLDVTVTSGKRVIGRSGQLGRQNEVDRWAHFVNQFVLDREGNRINRRNPQDIFVPLYNHQIPPGAGQVVHYALEIPPDVTEPVAVEVKLQYRKFDSEYMEFVARASKSGDNAIRGRQPGKPYNNELPITTLASDRIVFPLADTGQKVENAESKIPVWQRWNDYGIGLLLEGDGSARTELRQAAAAFEEVEKLKRPDGPLNLARVLFTEGRLSEAVDAINRAAKFKDPPAPAWTLAWLSGLINRQEGRLTEAEENFRSVLEDRTDERLNRGFDFSLDYEVINELGLTLFEQAKQASEPDREPLLRAAAEQFERTLKLDPENVAAHYSLQLVYTQLGDKKRATDHQTAHARYKTDDNARDRAQRLARRKYPAANHAAENVVIHSLREQPQLADAPPAAQPIVNNINGGGQ